MAEYIEKPDMQYILHIRSDKKVEKRLIEFCVESVVDVFEDTGLTADVQPVKHGRWVYSDIPIFGNPYGRYCCSLCGLAMYSGTDNYCPCCGARMGGNIT